MKECNQCGKCCIKYSNGGLTVSVAQLDYWENYRPDIFRYVNEGNIWIDPDTGEQIELCPWLKKASGQNKYTCDIYYDRPDDCRYYPSTIDEMVIDECEMLEEKDQSNPKQARKALDKIMKDSRSPF